MNYRFFDFERNLSTEEISLLFPGWVKGSERIVVFSPHDDDALIGCGYALSAALDEGASVYILIFCNGSAGYSTLEQRDKITTIRREETVKAYNCLGIPAENIIRFDLEDFSVHPRLGWKLPHGEEGVFAGVVRTLRKLAATRTLIPNGYREHFDHEAVFKSAAYDTIQAGDPILANLGQAEPVRSILQYSVWADFDPENLLLFKHGLRADKAVSVSETIERKVREALQCFDSQQEIIKTLILDRENRWCEEGYIELYARFEARPKLDFNPYLSLIRRIQSIT